jgi:4-diphosphocytidyl-2-C-methyl-D-erythritol kinase
VNTRARPDPGLPSGPNGRVLFPPAKVNLFLDVLGKRADGYHDVATLLVPVSLYDTLEIQPSGDGELKLECHPDTLPSGPGNLVWKAAEALRRAFGVTAGATMRLTKRIPHEAGLGGGSSDAAVAIAGLNAVWGLNRGVSELLPVAASVGSDVPGFLVAGGTVIPACEPTANTGRNACATRRAAWCTGRGEVVTPVPAGGPIHLVIVKPPVGCPTAEVYKRFRRADSPADPQRVLSAFARGDAEELAAGLHNALQPAAFDLQPLVRKVYDRLTNCRPLGVLLSGSGASVFAVGRDAADSAAVAERFARHTDPELAACRVFAVRTL